MSVNIYPKLEKNSLNSNRHCIFLNNSNNKLLYTKTSLFYSTLNAHIYEYLMYV